MAIVHHPPDVAYSWPSEADLRPTDMLLGFDQVADILTVAFGGTVRPATVEPLDWTPTDYVALRLDPETYEVVGIHLEAVRLRALREHPSWRAVVDAAPTEPGMRRADESVWPALESFVAEVKKLAGD